MRPPEVDLIPMLTKTLESTVKLLRSACKKRFDQEFDASANPTAPARAKLVADINERLMDIEGIIREIKSDLDILRDIGEYTNA